MCILVSRHAAQVLGIRCFYGNGGCFSRSFFHTCTATEEMHYKCAVGQSVCSNNHTSPKPHRAPIVLGMKDEPTPLWDLQCFRLNWNNCTKQQWIWTTDGRVCKCLSSEHVCRICLHFKGIVRTKVIILSFTLLHLDPVWIFVNNDFNVVPHSKLLYS